MMAEIIDWGFDLTGFGSAEKFSALLKRHHLSKYERVKHLTVGDMSYYHFVWSNPDLILSTSNNPLTGEYTGGDAQREREKGYASYIAIRGKKDKVLALVKDIKKTTKDIKDESKYVSEFSSIGKDE
jgi:hypothetical protein